MRRKSKRRLHTEEHQADILHKRLVTKVLSQKQIHPVVELDSAVGKLGPVVIMVTGLMLAEVLAKVAKGTDLFVGVARVLQLK